MSTGTTSNICDRCSRSLEGKGYLLVSGMKICGICQFEVESNRNKEGVSIEYVDKKEFDYNGQTWSEGEEDFI